MEPHCTLYAERVCLPLRMWRGVHELCVHSEVGCSPFTPECPLNGAVRLPLSGAQQHCKLHWFAWSAYNGACCRHSGERARGMALARCCDAYGVCRHWSETEGREGREIH